MNFLLTILSVTSKLLCQNHFFRQQQIVVIFWLHGLILHQKG